MPISDFILYYGVIEKNAFIERRKSKSPKILFFLRGEGMVTLKNNTDTNRVSKGSSLFINSNTVYIISSNDSILEFYEVTCPESYFL